MSKTKKILPIFLIFFLTFGITLFSIYSSTAITLIDNDSQQKRIQVPNSIKNNAIENSSEIYISNTEKLADIPAETHVAQEIALLNEQDSDMQNVISRGTTNRTTYYKENQIETAIAPTETESDPQYEHDLDLLARLITAEAQGEPYEAQVAVGAVVMNRVESGLWAATIADVIYQNINGYYQFTPVVNGWIDKPAEPESIKAAEAAMSGTDPTNGAQFYYDDQSTNTWILSKTVSIQIGHMIYAY
jgi:spore germination cell wall hydrolase CwlJ-like protein